MPPPSGPYRSSIAAVNFDLKAPCGCAEVELVEWEVKKDQGVLDRVKLEDSCPTSTQTNVVISIITIKTITYGMLQRLVWKHASWLCTQDQYRKRLGHKPICVASSVCPSRWKLDISTTFSPNEKGIWIHKHVELEKRSQQYIHMEMKEAKPVGEVVLVMLMHKDAPLCCV